MTYLFSVTEPALLWDPEGRLLLQSVRSLGQSTSPIYGMVDRFRGTRGGRRVVSAST